MGTIHSLEEGVLHVDTTEDLVAGERVVYVEEKKQKGARRVLVGSGEKR